ncbi:hypothetical protein ABIE53_001206 [Burkholderia sp. OAS925]
MQGTPLWLRSTPINIHHQWQGDTHETSQSVEVRLHVRRARACRPRAVRARTVLKRPDQGRRPAFAVGHDGDLRDIAERHRADDDRGHQQERWRDGPSASAGGRRPGIELAALRRKSASTDHAGKMRGGVRLLDFRVAQVGAAGLRGTQRPAVLPRAVRRRRDVAQRVLHGRGAEPAGDSRNRISDERGRRRREALLPARHRLCVSAHDEQDPARVPEVEGRAGRRHPGGLHAVRP